MSPVLEEPAEFYFRVRPRPVPGDLRIIWRMSVICLILVKSRRTASSIERLYIMNDAIRADSDPRELLRVLAKEIPSQRLHVRVEPALGRALDLMAAERLIAWQEVASRAGIRLTSKGQLAAKAIWNADDVLHVERERVSELASKLTEKATKMIIQSE